MMAMTMKADILSHTRCLAARCGDGVIHAGVEECDDGNPINTDGGISNCTAPSVGTASSILEVEECDDGNRIDTDACRNTCEPARVAMRS